MTTFGLKLPTFALHEAFNIGAFNIKVFTDVWDARGVLFLALFGYNAGRFYFRRSNYKWIGYRFSIQLLFFAN